MARRRIGRGQERDAGLVRGRAAVVTGAGSGIGRAIALGLAAEGFVVCLVGRHRPALARVARAMNGAGQVCAADVSTEAGRATIARRMGRGLSVLVHSAGAYPDGPATRDRSWAALDAVNVHAPVLLTQACLPQLRKEAGQVVFVNSTAGLRSGAGPLAYAAGKHALRCAADILRQDVNAHGIRVLSVFPGRTDTPMQRGILASERRAAPRGTLMRPEDVAEMVLAALKLPRSAEVTDIVMRPSRPLPSKPRRLRRGKEKTHVVQRGRGGRD